MKVERSPQRAKKTVGGRGGGGRGPGQAGKGTTQRRDPAARAERSSTARTAGGEPKGRGGGAPCTRTPDHRRRPESPGLGKVRSDRTSGVLRTATRDEREQPCVLGLLQPQPQLRGVLPVPAARRRGRAALLLRLRRPQVLLQRAGQLLPLQAQLHVEPQVGRAEQGLEGQGGTGQSRAGQGRAGRDRAGQDDPSRTWESDQWKMQTGIRAVSQCPLYSGPCAKAPGV